MKKEDLVERLAEQMYRTHNHPVPTNHPRPWPGQIRWQDVNPHIKRQYRKFAATAIRELAALQE